MIRLAEISDLPEIIQIYNAAVIQKGQTAHINPLVVEDRVSWFESHIPTKYPIYIFIKENAVQGWISLSPYRQGREALKKTIEISYYVHPDHQNQASIRLLKKFGFNQWGYLPEIAEIEGVLYSHVYLGKRV